MNKQELKHLYRLNKITAKEYFYQLGMLIKADYASTPSKNFVPDYSALDGKLPFN